MRRWKVRVARLAGGGIALGLLLGFSAVSFNEILFEFLLQWFSIIAAVLFGGDLADLNFFGGSDLTI